VVEDSSDAFAATNHSRPTSTTTLQSLPKVQHQDHLQLLLIEFEHLFAEPSTLPPTSFFYHSIYLKPNAEPKNIQSNRYPPLQKDEIEKIVKEMLANSII